MMFKDSLVYGLAFVGVGVVAGLAEADTVVRFNRDVRPILSDNCFHCHGPDAKHRKAELRLDVEADAKASRDGAQAFAPGDLAKSEAWRLISSADPKERMPPLKSHKALTAAQMETIRLWIEQGAKWEGHWAFVAPSKPAAPAVRRADWVRNPIDAFTAAALTSQSTLIASTSSSRSISRWLRR